MQKKQQTKRLTLTKQKITNLATVGGGWGTKPPISISSAITWRDCNVPLSTYCAAFDTVLKQPSKAYKL